MDPKREKPKPEPKPPRHWSKDLYIFPNSYFPHCGTLYLYNDMPASIMVVNSSSDHLYINFRSSRRLRFYGRNREPYPAGVTCGTLWRRSKRIYYAMYELEEGDSEAWSKRDRRLKIFVGKDKERVVSTLFMYIFILLGPFSKFLSKIKFGEERFLIFTGFLCKILRDTFLSSDPHLSLNFTFFKFFLF